MRRDSVFPNLVRKVACVSILCGLAALFGSSTAHAKPITYSAFTITSGKLGSWSFTNARVYISMLSDTSFVQFIQTPIDPTNPANGTVDTYVNPTGIAWVTIISGTKVVRAIFAPNQIFADMDLGDTSSEPEPGARGVGFGSFTATGIEPTYPLGIDDGIVHARIIPEFAIGGTESTELAALPANMVSNVAYSGRAWPCSGFLNVQTYGVPCTPPAPLHTDKGDFYLYLPYEDLYFYNGTTYYYDSLSAGFFTETLGISPDPALLPSATPLANASEPITYHGYTVSDVTLGGHAYKNAQVYFSVAADAAATVPFSNGTSHGYMNSRGNAHVTVVSNGQSVSAEFNPGQIYVYWDVGNGGIGFGSVAGKNGYPLSINQSADFYDLVGDSSVGAIWDILQTPGDVQYYTPPTATLVTDLTNATTLSGAASACVDFDPATTVCSDLTPIPLKTNRGNFTISEPYTADIASGSQYSTAGPYSVNWGVFWSELGAKSVR